jgi:hypothetical protein
VATFAGFLDDGVEIRSTRPNKTQRTTLRSRARRPAKV